jgi:hypothetical protein
VRRGRYTARIGLTQGGKRRATAMRDFQDRPLSGDFASRCQ